MINIIRITKRNNINNNNFNSNSREMGKIVGFKFLKQKFFVKNHYWFVLIFL